MNVRYADVRRDEIRRRAQAAARHPWPASPYGMAVALHRETDLWRFHYSAAVDVLWLTGGIAQGQPA